MHVVVILKPHFVIERFRSSVFFSFSFIARSKRKVAASVSLLDCQ